MAELLKLVDVTKKYGQSQALDGFNLELSAGKIIGLLGPNGSGKTTLIKLINGLLQPTTGEVLVNGMKPCVETKKIVSYLPDTSYLKDYMKVSDIVEMFADFYEDFDSHKAYHLLDDLGIDSKSYLKNLSKGNKEKVQLILVMSRRAKLYILDEPIAGVDPAARDYILRTIINNYSEEASVLISTHLITDIEPILDEAVFIKNGQLVLHGNTDDLRLDYGCSIDSLFRKEFRV